MRTHICFYCKRRRALASFRYSPENEYICEHCIELYSERQLVHYVNVIFPQKVFVKGSSYKSCEPPTRPLRPIKPPIKQITPARRRTLRVRKKHLKQIQKETELYKRQEEKRKKEKEVRLLLPYRERLQRAVTRYTNKLKKMGIVRRSSLQKENTITTLTSKLKFATIILERFEEKHKTIFDNYCPTKVLPSWRIEYNEYLASDEWKQLVCVLKEQRGSVCEECQGTERITIHHLSYVNFKNESLSDLQVLCWKCHQGKHSQDNTLSYGYYIKHK